MSTPAIQRTCPVCGEKNAREILRKGELRLVQCASCAMVYASPVNANLVSGAFYDDLASGFYLSPDKLQSDYAPVRFARELSLLRRFCPRGKILDVGCSNGAFLFHAQQRFPGDYETLGVDVAGAALDYAAGKGVPVRKGLFLEMDFKNEAFSAVTFWATLEHLVDPAAYLSKAASALQPGGCCFILVPNFTSLAVRLLGAKYRYILPQHVNYFTRATLQKLAAREPGWQTIYLGSTHFNPLVLWQDWQNRAPVSDADRVRLLKRTTAYKQNPALAPFKFGLTLVERVLGAQFLADNLILVLRQSQTHSNIASSGQV
jgi:SAM-dependent methyltransferase